MTKLTSEDAGCWIDGHNGIYASEKLVAIAESFGYESTLLHDPSNPADSEEWIMESEWAEDWLNDFVAPEGYSFGWFDGEFFLWTWEEWDMD